MDKGLRLPPFVRGLVVDPFYATVVEIGRELANSLTVNSPVRSVDVVGEYRCSHDIRMKVVGTEAAGKYLGIFPKREQKLLVVASREHVDPDHDYIEIKSSTSRIMSSLRCRVNVLDERCMEMVRRGFTKYSADTGDIVWTGDPSNLTVFTEGRREDGAKGRMSYFV